MPENQQARDPAPRRNAYEWHGRSAQETLSAFESSLQGLSDSEAGRRLEEHGPNLLSTQAPPPAWRILLSQFKSIVIIVLVIAGLVAVSMRQWPESIAIAAVIAVNAAIGFFSEWRARRSMEALRQLGKHTTCVRRDGDLREISATELVPGDVVVLRAEALAPADCRILEADSLRVNEAALTGESAPVYKQAEPVSADAPLPERTSMLHKGTTVADGTVIAVVVATGDDTEVGRISTLAQQAEAAATPLQQKLDRLGRRMAVIVLAAAGLIGAVGLLAGRDPLLMIETAIALGVAAIPEGLPIVATIALAHGMWLMARRNALVNRLPAVETLGATRVIFTDKTGTLTENHMTMRKIVTEAEAVEFSEGRLTGQVGADVHGALRAAVLCNGATLGEVEGGGSRGDPLELAILETARDSDLARDRQLQLHPQRRVVEFDRETMMMATYHDDDEGLLVVVKGAPQAVLDAADRYLTANGEIKSFDPAKRDEWRRRAEQLASEGLRLLAAAEKHVDDEQAEPYENLCFLGLLGLLDPPRTGVRDAINACQAAGLDVVMITGDKPQTAEAIAEQVGIVGDPGDPDAQVVHGDELKPPDELDEAHRAHIHRSNIFARVTPEQKLNLVTTYQEYGEIVAMTGDGVNDAPALKKADIGIAMGRRGTDAARQVADMVLRDDAFETIVAAVRQGRIIFGNIRRSVMFMLCTNGAEVLAVAVAALLAVPLPLRPLQILFLNVLTDVLPALALGVGKGEADVMDRPPRDPGESVLTRPHWTAIGIWSAVIAGAVLAGLYAGLQLLGLPKPAAVTVSFLTLGFGKLWFVFNLRSTAASAAVNEITRNPWIWAAIVLCAALLVAAVYLPGLSDVLDTRPLDLRGWGVALALSLAPLILGQGWLLWRGTAKPRRADRR